MIKSLIWALWSAEREGADGTFQSSETPIAILHYYWSLHWDKQRSIDPHTNKIREKKKNTSVPLGPDTAAGRRTDRHIVRREGREKRKSQAYKSGWKDTVSHWFACLCVSLCAWISEYISVWSAPGDHCQSCNDTSGGKLVHEAINIQKHSTFWFISRRGCSSKQEGVRGRWHRNR